MSKLLLVGAGDIAQHFLNLPPKGFKKIYVLLRQRLGESQKELEARKDFWRKKNATPIVADLDDFKSLNKIKGLADAVVHLAPPNPEFKTDTRTTHLLCALAQNPPKTFIYISTTGVYGNCPKRWINENTPPAPISARAKQRLNAEKQCRAFAKKFAHQNMRLCILRVPGIYSATRLPLKRIQEKTPALTKTDDIYTNHIHACDLSRAILGALFFGKAQRVYNITDDSDLKLGDYLDLLADYHNLPRPPRLPFKEIKKHVSTMQYSFLCESRRIEFKRWQKELKVKMCYPTVQDFLKEQFPR